MAFPPTERSRAAYGRRLRRDAAAPPSYHELIPPGGDAAAGRCGRMATVPPVLLRARGTPGQAPEGASPFTGVGVAQLVAAAVPRNSRRAIEAARPLFTILRRASWASPSYRPPSCLIPVGNRAAWNDPHQ